VGAAHENTQQAQHQTLSQPSLFQPLDHADIEFAYVKAVNVLAVKVDHVGMGDAAKTFVGQEVVSPQLWRSSRVTPAAARCTEIAPVAGSFAGRTNPCTFLF